jgi:hypothetical protein
MSESEQHEDKSHFDWEYGQQFALLKTIVAFGNLDGGKLVLKNVICDPARLDSARLDDFVNKYIEPRLGGIKSTCIASNTWEIQVQRSPRAPHVIAHEASYKDKKGKLKSAFYPGQIYVRHSSKSEAATADDVHSMIQNAVASWLIKIGQSIESLSLDIGDHANALPVRLSDSATALKIGVADPNTDYPYTAKTMGACVKRNQNWTHATATRLGLKDNPVYSISILGANGVVMQRRYNDNALNVVREKLKECPDYDPYRDGR